MGYRKSAAGKSGEFRKKEFPKSRTKKQEGLFLWEKSALGEKKKNQWMILGLRFGLFLSALAVMEVFAGSFMKILGMTYDGIGSLILFFVAASVIGYILNLAAGVLIGLFMQASARISDKTRN